jgi:DNA-binding transcriptional LysR family regulator
VQLATIDLNLLVVLDAIIDTRSVKQAATRLALSPSATSHALARARELVGDPILVRAGKDMVLTTRAAELRPRLRDLLEGVERALIGDDEVDPATLRRSFTLATTDYVELLLLGEVSRDLAGAAPGVEMLSQRVSESVLDQLRSGACDLAAGVFTQLPDDIVKQPLFSDSFVCLLRRNHPVLRRKLTPARYAALDHILISPRGGHRGTVDEILARHGLERRVARTVSSFVAAPFMVAGSDHVLTLPRRIAAKLAGRLGLVAREPPLELPTFTVSMAWQRRYEADPIHAWLRARLADAAARLAVPQT